MNRERMLELADYIEDLEYVRYDDIGSRDWNADRSPIATHFNMIQWAAECECGTVCCIGGAAEIMAGTGPGTASKVLGLHGFNESALFHPPNRLDWDVITPEIAADALRKLANGEITLTERFWFDILNIKP